MGSSRTPIACVLAICMALAGCARPAAFGSGQRLMDHAIVLDADRRLLSWSNADSPYAEVARLAADAFVTRFAVQESGVETWLAWSRFDPESFEGVNWPHNPAGLYAMVMDSATLWYAFSGDHRLLDAALKGLDAALAHGTTPSSWNWALVPYASADPGEIDYRGANDSWCDSCGRGDGTGVIEPDKVAELGFAYLQGFEVMGDVRYRDGAVACADALATHVRSGDALRSPWPFRVHAETGVVREEYSSNVVAAIVLFDELGRLDLGDTGAYTSARGAALDWLLRVPLKNDAWSGYFEDIEIQSDPAANPNQYSALRTARWLIAHPDEDPTWRADATHLLAWTAEQFGRDTETESGTQWGATVLSEQAADMAKMGSHTARFGATLALWFSATGDETAVERAARSLNWATYTCSDNGTVAVGPDANEGYWFSDGYGDYIRHFLVAMGAVPEWAPARENHILQSTSVVNRVDYGPGRIAWTTFDSDATETLRLTARPSRVSVGGVQLSQRTALDRQGFTVWPVASGGFVVRVRHRSSGEVVVALSSPLRF
ncbi:MAG: hypothetical protein ABTD50_06450 [Polyangiaceae bacterium]|jgi:hypothetical protein